MIDKQRVMDGTHQGLDILLDLYPQARSCVEGGKKQFKMRLNEKTPSATIRQNKRGEWVVHDFGGDDEDLNGIDAWMRFHGWDRQRFGAAVMTIAQEYGIFDELSKDKNFERIRERAARDDEPEGSWQYEMRDFTDRELKLLGPGVTREVCERLHWHALEWIGKVKDRRVKERHTSDTYPIFIRECFIDAAARADGGPDRFYKVYRPLEPEKRWRFMYFPEGAKPQGYINGLYELRKEHQRLNEKAREEEDDFQGTTAVSNLKKTVVGGVQRYYRVVLCSGERDALCVAARGDLPIWLNSETARLDRQDYQQIIRLAGELTNIPDLDATGQARGRAQALKFLDLKTVWLPETLMRMKDNRGRPSKDFRDWCQYFPTAEDYYDLMDQAVAAKFWTTRTNEKTGERRHKIDAVCLHHFLRLNGFGILCDERTGQEQLVRQIGPVVYPKEPRHVRDFVRLWAMGAADPDQPRLPIRQDARVHMEHSVRNLILTDVSFTPAYLGALPQVCPTFRSFSPSTQDFFFRNGRVHVHADGYELLPPEADDAPCSVWAQQVVQHDLRKLPDMFRVEWLPGELMPDGVTPRFRLTVTEQRPASHVLGYLINTSRLYWRQEVEEAFPQSRDAQLAYLDLHPFDISGEHLTERQQQEQQQCLLNKIFTLGYLLHQYKNPARPWAAFLMDNRVADIGQANGRTGKSFFTEMLKQLLQMDVLGFDAKRNDVRESHALSDITARTRLVDVQDLPMSSPVQDFYNLISGDLHVNPKGLTPYTIPFSESPKFSFSTNYLPADFDASSDARLLYVTFSDWYHQRTDENPFDYQETRTIADDFQGRPLFGSDYSEDEWNADLNLLLQCERFYLSIVHRPVRILPPMASIMQRKLKKDMGPEFERWATDYFAADSMKVNRNLVRRQVMEDYQRDCPRERGLSTQRFSIKLKAFAQWAPWIFALNPSDLGTITTQGRNIERITNPQTGVVEQCEMIHLRTMAQEQRMREADALWGDGTEGMTV